MKALQDMLDLSNDKDVSETLSFHQNTKRYIESCSALNNNIELSEEGSYHEFLQQCQREIQMYITFCEKVMATGLDLNIQNNDWSYNGSVLSWV